MEVRAMSLKARHDAPGTPQGEQSTFLQNILESSTEYSIIGKDLNGKIQLWNAGARRLYGYEPEEVIDKSNSSMLHTPEDIAAGKPAQIMAAALQAGKWEGTLNLILTRGPREKPASLECAMLPQAWDDEAMLRQVLINLLGNALKYSSQREQPVVEVGAIPGEDCHTFFVRDNGAGLDIASAVKLFEPFQRFHSAAEFPGTGVGLAIVKRIVERHGGRIWAESQPGAGATFFFTLPAKAPSEPKPE